MQGDWLQTAVGVLLVGVAIWFLATALARARKRRREELSEEAPAPARPRPAKVEVPPPPEPVVPEAPGAEAAPGKLEPVVEPTEPQEIEAPPRPRDPAFSHGLERTRASFMARFGQLFGRGAVDPAVLGELQDLLITADVGVALATRLVQHLREELASHRLESAATVRHALRARMLEALDLAAPATDPLAGVDAKPAVILFVGVNGVGKTTTIGKVAAKLRAQGRSVVLAAGDTFRAAAVEQLGVWAERTQSHLAKGEAAADPASVIFNAIDHARSSGADVVLADTAGRLHTKTALMDELKKIKRAAAKARVGAPDETWLVVDATTGQNALHQAREFHQALGLTGLILTKLDGTAKGGIVLAIADALRLPVQFAGVGEKADDLRPFDTQSFVDALLTAS